MAVFNGERHLKQAVDSILTQTFTDFEFIIIDDCSTDETKSILESYSDPRLTVLRNSKNIGLTKSLNRGIRQARGRYLARMDADDISEPSRFTRQIGFLESHPRHAVVGSFARVIDDKSSLITRWELPVDDPGIHRRLKRDNGIIHGSALIRMECLKAVGCYDGTIPYSQDYDLWLRLSERFRLANLPEYLYSQRRHGHSIKATRRDEQKKCVVLAKEKALARAMEKLLPLQVASGNTETGITRAITNYIASYLADIEFIKKRYRPLKGLLKATSFLTLGRINPAVFYRLYARFRYSRAIAAVVHRYRSDSCAVGEAVEELVVTITGILGWQTVINKEKQAGALNIVFLLKAFPRLSETFITNQITGLLDQQHNVTICARVKTHEEQVHEDVGRYRLMDRAYFYGVPSGWFRRGARALFLIAVNIHRNPFMMLKALNVFKYGHKALSLQLLYLVIPFLGNDVHIIHCHYGTEGLVGTFLKKLGVRAKLVTMFHGFDIRLGLKQGGEVYRPLFSHGDRLLAISNYSRTHLVSFGAPPGAIVTHPVGVDVHSFRYRWATAIDRRPEPVILITVARLVEEKGLHYGIKAVSTLLKLNGGLEVKYRIIGDGPLEKPLRNLIKQLDLTGVVELAGCKLHRQVMESLEAAHIFLLPSIAEALPVSLMEAQATGLPVVASDVGGIPEIVRDGESGFLVPAHAPEAIADKLAYLMEVPERWPAMGRQGRKRIEDKFDIEILNKRLAELYRDILSRP